MEPLNIARINITAPYKVWNEDGTYRFETDHGISYIVDFDIDDNPFYQCFWFNLTNPHHAKSPGDIKIAQTVICIIEEFFLQNDRELVFTILEMPGQFWEFTERKHTISFDEYLSVYEILKSNEQKD